MLHLMFILQAMLLVASSILISITTQDVKMNYTTALKLMSQR